MNESEPNLDWVDAEPELNVMTRNGMFQIKGGKHRRIVHNFETGEFLLGEEVTREQVWAGTTSEFPIIHKRDPSP